MLDLRQFGLDAHPNAGVWLDGLDHQVQFAEPALPQLDFGGERCIRLEQVARLRALLEIKAAKHIFGGQRIHVVEFAHDLRHPSISSRLRRRDARSRSIGMSSLAESCSRLKAP